MCGDKSRNKLFSLGLINIVPNLADDTYCHKRSLADLVHNCPLKERQESNTTARLPASCLGLTVKPPMTISSLGETDQENFE